MDRFSPFNFGGKRRICSYEMLKRERTFAVLDWSGKNFAALHTIHQKEKRIVWLEIGTESCLVHGDFNPHEYPH